MNIYYEDFKGVNHRKIESTMLKMKNNTKGKNKQ
jgi:hypothetical protein